MVALRKRKVKGKIYYYLAHTYREKGKVKYKETYIGRRVPSNVEQIKREFVHQIYKEKWFRAFERIKTEYSKELQKMPKSVLEENIKAFMVVFTYDTNKIEGSKLSFKDTAMLLEYGITPKDRPIRDIKETEAHRKVFYEMLDYKGDLSIGIVLKWHKELFNETKPEIAGKIRDYQVYITGTHYKPPTAIEVQSYLLEFFKWYLREKDLLNPVELAALVHIRFEAIHPFGDGNGRIGRLIMNFILHKNDYPMLNIPYVGRRGYYTALERAQIKKSEQIFVLWFFKRYLKDYKRYLD
ncbi:MAG: Fic family protein [Candidatus Marsarchaeota archaeon]|jgi:Fic family protein|nr:Fic family protein [Candidatus Marsarchaeota archaeon]